MEAEEGALVRRVGKEVSSVKTCNQKGGSLILEQFFPMKPCTNGITAPAGPFTGKDFSLKMEDIADKQASSLKLCPAECMSMEGINGEQEFSLKLCPTESLRMEDINGEQGCSLKMRATKRKSLPAGARKGEEYCSEGDILATAAVFSEDADKCADVAMADVEELAISDTKVEAAPQKRAPGAGFSEGYVTGDEDFDWSTEEEGDDDDVILSKAELQLVFEKADSKYNRFIGRLRARRPMLIKDYTAADFVDSDGEDVVHDKVEVAL